MFSKQVMVSRLNDFLTSYEFGVYGLHRKALGDKKQLASMLIIRDDRNSLSFGYLWLSLVIFPFMICFL